MTTDNRDNSSPSQKPEVREFWHARHYTGGEEKVFLNEPKLGIWTVTAHVVDYSALVRAYELANINASEGFRWRAECEQAQREIERLNNLADAHCEKTDKRIFELEAEIANLTRWKIEQLAVMAPILKFEHPEMPLGQSKITFILSLVKERDSALAEVEKLKALFARHKLFEDYETELTELRAENEKLRSE